MKTSTRTTLLAAGAFGFLVLLALGARADIIDPSQPTGLAQPKQPSTFLPARPAQAPSQPPQQQEEPPPPAPAVEAPPVVEAPPPAPAPTPAREHIVTRAVRPARSEAVKTSTTQGSVGPMGPFQQVIGAVNTGLRSVGVFLGEVASACKVGVASGTGGPVLVFAVLGMAAALERRWALRTRWATDEELPEFLYAWDVIAPG